MRPFGTDEPLATRRKRGLKLLAQGKSVREVADMLGWKERSVRRRRQEAKSPKKKRVGRLGGTRLPSAPACHTSGAGTRWGHCWSAQRAAGSG